MTTQNRDDVNEVKFGGNVGRDPELKYTKNGSAVCNFSVCSENKKGYKTWMNIVVWGSHAEECAGQLKKGMATIVHGKISVRSYDKNGQKVYVTEITANRCELPEAINSCNSQYNNQANDRANGYQPDPWD